MHYAKKIYFIDQALAESVGFRFSNDDGRTLENIVFIQLVREGWEIYFHKEQQECDFVLRDGYRIVKAIQVCESLSDPATKKREMGGLIEAMKTYDLNEGLIITADTMAEEIIQQENKQYNVKIIPCWQWLLDSAY